MKYISKEKVFEIIARDLLQNNPSFGYGGSVDQSTYQEIVRKLRCTKYGYYSSVYKIINKNKEFKTYFLKQAKSSDTSDITKLNLDTLQFSLIKMNVRISQVCTNYRSKDSLCGILCRNFNLKNSLKNRKNIYVMWRRLKNQCENTQEVNAPVETDQLELDQTSDQTSGKTQYMDLSRHIDDSQSAYTSTPKIYTGKYDANSYRVPGTSNFDNMLNLNSCNSTVSPENVDVHKQDVSPTEIKIPKELHNLSSPGKLIVDILPFGSKNKPLQEMKKSYYKECNFFEGSFEIDRNVWSIIYHTNKLDVKYYPYYLRNRIRKYVNNVCLIIFKYVKYLKNNAINIYGLCKHSSYSCKKFKIHIQNRQVFVYSTSLDYWHKGYATHQVRAVEREICKKNLLTTTPFNYKKNTLIDSSNVILKEGKNLQKIKSDSTLRMIRSEALSLLDRNKNDLIDMILMQGDHPEYIKEVSVPFNVKLFSTTQVQVLKLQRTGNELPFIHFDATGGLIRHPQAIKSKRIYFYTAVINLKRTKRIYPVFSMISASHDSNTIFKLLHDFRYFCEENNAWPAFSGVVTDFSYANLHAISKSFNRCTLKEYLQKTYHLSEKKMKPNDVNMVGIHLCCAHFIKMVCKDIDNKAKNNEQKYFFKDLLASSILLGDIDNLDKFVFNTFIILKSPFRTTQTELALESVKSLSKKQADTGEVFNP